MIMTEFLLAAGVAADAEAGDWGGVLWRGGALVVGIWLLWAAISSSVGLMLVPRPTYTKLSLAVNAVAKRVFQAVARRSADYFALDRLLAAQGPATVLFLLGLYLTIFVIAFALIFYGIEGISFLEAFARSGSGMTTLGFDVVQSPLPIFVMFLAAFMGSTIIAVFIGFLLTLYAAYTAREAGVSELSLLTGEPAWGPEMVVRTKRTGEAPDRALIGKWISWMCAMRVNQYVYPLLNHFRSPMPERHWVTSLLAILDAVAIRMSATDLPSDSSFVRFLAEGADTMHLLRRSEMARRGSKGDEEAVTAWRYEREILSSDAATATNPCVTREEWDEAMKFLAENGIPLKADRDEAWRDFSRLRSQYAAPACYLAGALFAVPAPWSGPRPTMKRFTVRTMWPQLAREAGFGKSRPRLS